MSLIGLPSPYGVYPVSRYPKENTFLGQLNTNEQRLYNYVDKGNWVLPNQNPLVQFLTLLPTDVTQSDEYLFNAINAAYNRIASTLSFTSIYTKGKNFHQVLFPEIDHHTLIHVPFGLETKPYKYYFDLPLTAFRPLTTLYTTDTHIRYSTHRLTNGLATNTYQSDYTIVSLNPIELGISYIKYCRNRIKDNRDIGLNPRSFIAGFILANFYLQHNQYVFTNLLKTYFYKIDTPEWSMVNINRELREYIHFQDYQLTQRVFTSFNHFIQQLLTIPKIESIMVPSIYPTGGLSKSFTQLQWIYYYGEIDWVCRYLRKLNEQGRDDTLLKAQLRPFLLKNENSIKNIISIPLWAHHFSELMKDLRELV